MDSITYHILQPKINTGFEHFNFIDNNNLILNTEDGFCWINVNHEPASKNLFKVFLHKVIITNDKGSLLARRQSFGKEINNDRFSHKQNSLRFEFIAPEYRNDGLVKYSYILENYDETWSEFNSDNIKEYTQLPKGKYVFKVRARDLLESKEAICTYTFIILPAWYESQIAFVIYGIFVLILIVGLMIWVNHRSKKGARDMEKLKEIEINEQKKIFEAETTEKK
jgi:hypothetical protein